MANSILAENVRRGWEKLAAYNPKWFENADRSALDVQSLDNCPVGQTFRHETFYSWSHGCQVLGVDSEDAFHYGFDIVDIEEFDDAPSDDVREYNRRVLNRMWKTVVTYEVNRREAMRNHPTYKG